jgi:hypothetical protein
MIYIYDISVNCNWVATQWQWYSTHLHTNNTQNDTKQTIFRTQNFWRSAGRAPVFPGFTLAFALQLRKKQGKTLVRVAEECQLAWCYIRVGTLTGVLAQVSIKKLQDIQFFRDVMLYIERAGLNIPKNNIPTPSGSSSSVQAGNASASISLQPTQFCHKELVALLMKYVNMILCNILGQTTNFTAMLLQPLI